MVNIDLSGGAIFEKKEDETAFAHRNTNSLFSFVRTMLSVIIANEYQDIIGVWDSDADTKDNISWANLFRDKVAKWQTGTIDYSFGLVLILAIRKSLSKLY